MTESDPDTLLAKVLSPERRRFIKFCVVGGSGVAVNLAFVWVGIQLFSAQEEAARDALASALGIFVSVFTNFLINDYWTWGDRPKGKRKRDFVARCARYYLASALAVALQYGVAMALTRAAGLHLMLAQLIGIALGTVVNYAINNLWTFRDRGPDSE